MKVKKIKKLQLYGFNNLTKTLSFNMYDICYAKTSQHRQAYIDYIDEEYNAERLTDILTEVAKIIGANILNIALVLGLPALIAPGSFATEAFTRDYGVMLLVSLIFAVLCWRRQQQPGRLVGALLVGGFVVWLAMLFWTAPLFVE